MTAGPAERGTPGVIGTTATVRATVAHPDVVAAALRPDDTEELTTAVADGAVEVSVERGDVGGLAATVDDVLVNLRVADRISTEPFDDGRADEVPPDERRSDAVATDDATTGDRPTDDATTGDRPTDDATTDDRPTDDATATADTDTDTP